MNEVLLGLQEKISENNNQYRDVLDRTNTSLENRTTVLVGGLVTLSNYEADFTQTTNKSNEQLLNPIIKIIEAYCVKDLRNIDNVNEQFLKKISDKLNKIDIDTDDKTIKFVDSLKKLLNGKYLEIVNIKRVPFFNENSDNIDIENIINSYTNILIESNMYNEEKLSELFLEYKNDIYKTIKNDLDSLNKLYISNFITEIEDTLTADINVKVNAPEKNEIEENILDDKPEIIIEKEPEVFIEEKIEKEKPIEELLKNIKEEKTEVIVNKPAPKIDEIFELTKPKTIDNTISVPKSSISTLDKVEEIKIDDLLNAMIERLTKRFNEIKNREELIKIETERLTEDEDFLKELLDSTDKKAIYLENQEKLLREKDIELKEKEKSLEEKLNKIMPFAKAVLKTGEETQ